MAQTLTQVKNPWGAAIGAGARGFDAQRTDLFTIDFGPVIAPLTTILGRVLDGDVSSPANRLLLGLPTASDTVFFPNAVEFPERRVGATATRRHEVAYPFPGYDEPLAQVNVTWTLDVGVDDIAPMSRVLALLRTWFAVTRAGRDGQDPNELSLTLRDASESGTGLIPDFRHDFMVYLWRGYRTAPADAAYTASDPSTAGLELSGRWLVRRGWLAGLQQGALRHAQGAPGEVRAMFLADTIVEV